VDLYTLTAEISAKNWSMHFLSYESKPQI